MWERARCVLDKPQREDCHSVTELDVFWTYLKERIVIILQTVDRDTVANHSPPNKDLTPNPLLTKAQKA